SIEKYQYLHNSSRIYATPPVDTLPATTLHSPAPFGKDNRRILISSNGLGQVPGTLGKIIKLDHPEKLHTTSPVNGKQAPPNISLAKNSPSIVIQVAYRQVFGRDVFEGQRITVAESAFLSGAITMREFIRQLAKSKLFRRMFWEPLYITKAIEYIHRRLLGRPTYGRQEMNHYYDISANQGFYALIDEMIDSPEYMQTFGEDTVPYERYVTPRGFAMRSPKSSYAVNLSAKSLLSSPSELDRFVPNHRNGQTQTLPELVNGCETNLQEQKLEAELTPVIESESQESYINPV
ncbi:photosystem I reaction center subunit XI, partial [Fischerella thermalis BR2B]|uniref:phycobilisome rod-core linker polypeptide n=1 Tax=Fischerella thermalis TaxID=372787 RepID=UPI000CBEEBAE